MDATNFNGEIIGIDRDTFGQRFGYTFGRLRPNLSFMFYNAQSFNQDISHWVVCDDSDTRFMFKGATSFNQNLNAWNMRTYADFRTGMFMDCPAVHGLS